MEKELDKVREERGSIEEQSLMVFEENEDRLRTIQEHESVSVLLQLMYAYICYNVTHWLYFNLIHTQTIALLKGNVILLEDQINVMKVEFENDALRSTPRHRTPRHPGRRSGVCQTETPTPSKRYRHIESSSGATQTSFLADSTTSADGDEVKSAAKQTTEVQTSTSFITSQEKSSGCMQTESSLDSSGIDTRSRFRSNLRICPTVSESSEDLDSSQDQGRSDVKVTVKVTHKRSKSTDKYQTSSSPERKSSKKRKSDPPEPEDWDENSTLEVDEEEEERIQQLEEAGEHVDESKSKKNVKTWRQIRSVSRHLKDSCIDQGERCHPLILLFSGQTSSGERTL